MIDTVSEVIALFVVAGMVSAMVGGYVHEMLREREAKRVADKHHKILERDRERALLKLEIMKIEKEREK